VDEATRQRNVAFMPLGEALILAERCLNDGRLTEAESVCRRLLDVQPSLPQAEHLLGVIAYRKGALGDAIGHAERATKLAPHVALFHANLGEMHRLAGRPELAANAARRALEIEPKMPMALSNLGVALCELKDYTKAARAQRKAIAADPNFAEAHCNLGNALHGLKRFDEAIAAYRRAIELKPDYADAWANLGTTLHHGGDFDEAIVALRHATALSPHHANAHSGLGILLLMRGDFGEGWDEYEWRLLSSERKGPRFPEKPWQGENLAGKHIYVQAEQGLGDTLQFVRYLPLLAARAGKVTLRVQQQLVTLLRESLSGIAVLGDRGDPAPYEFDAALLSLPRLLKTRPETVPAELPYLRAPARTTQRFSKRFTKLEGIKVGLVWAGNPEHVNDHRRSLTLAMFKPLFALRGTSLVSLQVGPRAVDLKKLKRRKSAIDDVAPELVEFADTAGAVAALDLMITVDTAVAHLAGALGKPVWLLLPWVTDWRWMLVREDCSWYPTMRLFRQSKGEDWTDVIARVAKELCAVAQGDIEPLLPFKAEGDRRAAQAAAIIAAEATHAASAAVGQAQTNPAGHALIRAEQMRRLGLLAEADKLSRRAVAAEPDNAEAEHMLGIIAHQSGKAAEAIEHLRRAIALNPNAALYHANLGEMYRLAGRTEEAIAVARRALEINPEYPEALSNLGIALFDRGEFETALAHYERAIALQDDFAQAHSNRGNALQRLTRFDDAEKSYRRAVALQPGFAEAWNNLGTCLRELKRVEEAEAVYRKALELSPHNPDTLDNLALAVKDLERLDEAADLLRRALAIESRADKIHLHYGAVLLEQGNAEEAAAAAERAIALNAKSHDAVNLMGRVAFERGDLDGAFGHFRAALALKPDLADAYNNMGNVLKELGKLRDAEAAYVEAQRLDPSVIGVYVNLADSKKFVPGDPHLAAMEMLAAKTASLSKTDRFQLDFALGKAYADLKDHDRAFRHLLAGNAGKRATISYDERAAFALFDRIEAVFTRELIAAKTGGGDASALPIFVLGMPRSGTTLVEQILASHPAVHGAGELKTLNDVVLSVRTADGDTIPYPEFISGLDAAALKKIGARYLDRLREHSPDAQRVTDKMPSNYYFAGLIHLALPNAKIVHTIRDPLDTCISCFSKLFTAEQSFTYDLAELGRHYKRYDRLMAHWRGVLPPGRILDVRYEDVVADLQGQARRIIAHCGLPWDERCLSFHETDRPVRTASATQVRQPIYQSAVGRWRAYQKHLRPLLSSLTISS